MELTRERIRQIETKAIRQLKHLTRLGALKAGKNISRLSGQPDDGDEDEDLDECEPTDSYDDTQAKELARAIATKPSRKNAIKPPRAAVEIPSFDTAAAQPTARHHSVSGPVQKLLDAATVLGASVKVDQKGADNSIWIDFSKAPTTPSRLMIRKLVDSGFKFWPGKGYWR